MNDGRSYIEKYGDKLADRFNGWFCHYCWIPLVRGEISQKWYDCPFGYGIATVDHKQPKARGGSDSLSNLVLCCANCNTEKADSSYADFYSMTAKRRARRTAKRGIVVRPPKSLSQFI